MKMALLYPSDLRNVPGEMVQRVGPLVFANRLGRFNDIQTTGIRFYPDLDLQTEANTLDECSSMPPVYGLPSNHPAAPAYTERDVEDSTALRKCVGHPSTGRPADQTDTHLSDALFDVNFAPDLPREAYSLSTPGLAHPARSASSKTWVGTDTHVPASAANHSTEVKRVRGRSRSSIPLYRVREPETFPADRTCRCDIPPKFMQAPDSMP